MMQLNYESILEDIRTNVEKHQKHRQEEEEALEAKVRKTSKDHESLCKKVASLVGDDSVRQLFELEDGYIILYSDFYQDCDAAPIERVQIRVDKTGLVKIIDEDIESTQPYPLRPEHFMEALPYGEVKKHEEELWQPDPNKYAKELKEALYQTMEKPYWHTLLDLA